MGELTELRVVAEKSLYLHWIPALLSVECH